MGCSSWLRPLLSDEVFDQEFAPQQAARVVRNAAQPLFLSKLAFAGNGIGWCGLLTRLRLGQSGGGIAAGLGRVVRCLILLRGVRVCVAGNGRLARVAPAGLLLVGLGLSLLGLTLSGGLGLGASCLALGRFSRLRRIV